MANMINSKKLSKRSSGSLGSKSFVHQPLRSIASLNQLKIGNATGGQVAAFLLKTIALESVRRISKAKCPILWTGLQSLQIFCYPPLKWIQRWTPFGFIVGGMQKLSRPMLVLSVVNVLSDNSESGSCNTPVDDPENTQTDGCPEPGPESSTVSSLDLCDQNMRIGDNNSEALLSPDWMSYLGKELQNQGIRLPERLNQGELQRFYVAANGYLPNFLSSVKKTIKWRETYGILSEEELVAWSNFVFWHGHDVKHQPCLIVRLGLACINLPSRDRPCFVQAVVSQVEYGVLHLTEDEDPKITVIVDCHGLSPLKIPMKMLRYCSNLLQDHFPNVLGCLIIIRLPPVVRVVAQTFIQVLKPTTKQKLRIEGEAYQRLLSEFLGSFPPCIGGNCTCTKCVGRHHPRASHEGTRGSIDGQVEEAIHDEDISSLLHPGDRYEVMADYSFGHSLRTAVVGILMVWILITLLEGLYNPESRPTLAP